MSRTVKALILTVAAILVGGLAVASPASAAEPKASLPSLEEEVMCPICGTLLGLSHSPAAERQRVFIRKLIREGKDEQQIKDALVAEYGPQVLAMPDDKGINLYAYLVPVLGFVLGGLGVAYAVLRWRRNRSNAEPGAGPSPPPPSDSERVDRDMAKYDL